MEDHIGNITAFLKGMQSWIDRQHDLVKQSLDANMAVLQDLSAWKLKVQVDIEKLQSNVRNLCDKNEHLSSKKEELTNPAYKVFNEEHLNLAGHAAVHLASGSRGTLTGPCARGDEHGHRVLGNLVVTTFVPTPVTGVKHSAIASPVQFTVGSPMLTNASQFMINRALPLWSSLNLMVVTQRFGSRSVRTILRCIMYLIILSLGQRPCFSLVMLTFGHNP
jgi:hypothetical protein